METTTPVRLAKVQAFIQGRRDHAAKAVALAQAVERNEGPIYLAHDKDRDHVVRELRAEASQADAVASAVESALSILFEP